MMEIAKDELVELHNSCLYTLYEWSAFDCVNTLVISSRALDLNDLIMASPIQPYSLVLSRGWVYQSMSLYHNYKL